MKEGRETYQTPLCTTIQLQHRELIATSLVTMIIITESFGSYQPIGIEDLGYEDL